MMSSQIRKTNVHYKIQWDLKKNKINVNDLIPVLVGQGSKGMKPRMGQTAGNRGKVWSSGGPGLGKRGCQKLLRKFQEKGRVRG